MAEHNETKAAAFIDFILNSPDLRVKDKIGILEHSADEYFLHDHNLLFLECKLALKELHEQQKKI